MRATATQREIRKFAIKIGDVIITKDSEDWKDIGISSLVQCQASDLVCGYHLALLRRNAAVLLGPFLHRVLQSEPVALQLRVAANGVTRYGLEQASVKTLQIPVPPLDEQAAIVRFLDHATRRIDRVIREKRRLIALLNEQKQAVIHRAVTQGLDAGAPTKDSGLPCLGLIPAHWQVRKIRTCTELLVSNVDKLVNAGEEPVRLCNYTDVYRNEVITAGMPFMRAGATLEEVSKFRLRVGDVVITKDSESWTDIAVPSLVEYEADDFVCGYHLGILRPRKAIVCSRFLLRVLQDRILASQFHVRAKGVTRFGLSGHAINECSIPIPPLSEQHSIEKQISKESEGASRLVESLGREITLLREYRTRLVADVVTGQLDVREAARALPDESLDPTDSVVPGDPDDEPTDDDTEAA